MKIGIITLPPHHNYGGILQAYALQTVLERMGNESELVVRDHVDNPSFKGWCVRLLVMAKLISKLHFRRAIGCLPCLKNRHTKMVTLNTSAFIRKYIRGRHKRLSEVRPGEYDAFVVGSDQIWRRAYNDKIGRTNAFLNFAYKWNNLRRVAYAASFGMDQTDYKQSLHGKVTKLLAKFDAVSVREKSGIDICREFGREDAVHVLDPTMLLTSGDYNRLIDDKPLRSGVMFSYILDSNPALYALVDKVSTLLGVKPVKMSVRDEVSPPVEDWLSGFRDAEFVVTDSFHGTVFSIIYRKPFVVFGNRGRGMARFESLLGLFNLQDHLISSVEEFDSGKDYSIPNSVYDILDEKKRLSMDFLYNALDINK